MNYQPLQDPKLPQEVSETQRHLAAELEKNPLPAPRMNAAAKATLRQNLLAQHGRSPSTPWFRFRGAVGTAVALLILTSAVAFFWISQMPKGTAVAPITAARDTATPTMPTPAPTETPAAQPTPTLPSLSSGLVMERVGDPRFGADSSVVTLYGFADAPPQPFVGDPLTVELLWLHEGQPQTWNSFIHLLDDSDQLAAQADAPLWIDGRFQQNQSFTLPTIGLAPGNYNLVAGVYDPASGSRLPVDDGTVGSVTALLGTVVLAPAAPPITAAQPDGSNILHVTALSLPAGSTLTTATPITVTLDYTLDSYDNGYITVKVVEMLPGGSFRGLADASANIARGIGTLTLIIPFTPAELNGPTDLGLLIEGRTDSNPRTPPNIFLDMPNEALWHYEP